MLSILLAFHLLVGSREHRTCNKRSRSVKAQKLWKLPLATMPPVPDNDANLQAD
jgi:hypothetical protein